MLSVYLYFTSVIQSYNYSGGAKFKEPIWTGPSEFEPSSFQ